MSAELLPEHLLEQAKHLSRRERTRPRQASLEARDLNRLLRLVPLPHSDSAGKSAQIYAKTTYNRAYRWFDHGAMFPIARVAQDVVRIPNSRTHSRRKDPRRQVALRGLDLADLLETQVHAIRSRLPAPPLSQSCAMFASILRRSYQESLVTRRITSFCWSHSLLRADVSENIAFSRHRISESRPTVRYTPPKPTLFCFPSCSGRSGVSAP